MRRQEWTIFIPVTHFRNIIGFSRRNLISNGPTAMHSKIYLVFFRFNNLRFSSSFNHSETTPFGNRTKHIIINIFEKKKTSVIKNRQCSVHLKYALIVRRKEIEKQYFVIIFNYGRNGTVGRTTDSAFIFYFFFYIKYLLYLSYQCNWIS